MWDEGSFSLSIRFCVSLRPALVTFHLKSFYFCSTNFSISDDHFDLGVAVRVILKELSEFKKNSSSLFKTCKKIPVTRTFCSNQHERFASITRSGPFCKMFYFFLFFMRCLRELHRHTKLAIGLTFLSLFSLFWNYYSYRSWRLERYRLPVSGCKWPAVPAGALLPKSGDEVLQRCLPHWVSIISVAYLSTVAVVS